MRCEVLVVGGGPAGAAAALGLARGGREVLLVERDAVAQDKVCGEFLSVEACGCLEQCGVDLGALGAVEIGRVRLARGEVVVAEAALPFRALSLSRRVMDEALLGCAERSGVRVLRGEAVEELDTGGRARLRSGCEMSAAEVVVATGKHDLRGRARPAGRQSGLIAYKMHWRLSEAQRAALEGGIELFLFPGGYGGLSLVEDGVANLCLLVRESRRLRWDELLVELRRDCGLLRERLSGAEALWAKPLAISHIPYGFVRSEADGAWWVGDQAAVIPSFTGDGMAVALHSGRVAAEMMLAGRTAEGFQRRMRSDVGRQVGRATALSRLLVGAPAAAGMAARMWPGGLAVLARATRIPAECLYPHPSPLCSSGTL